MNKIFLLVVSLFAMCQLQAFPDLQNIIEAQSQGNEIEAPNPSNLKPQWWKYFNAEGEELTKRIHQVIQNLHSADVPLEQREGVDKLLANIKSNLHAYASSKIQNNPDPLPERIFLNSYTLTQQLDLHHKIRKFTIEINNEIEELEQNKIKIKKAEKFIDNLMVTYLANNKSASERFILGLNIIQRRLVMGIAEQNNAILKTRIDLHQKQLRNLQSELEATKELLNLQVFDENQMNQEINKAQHEYQTAQGNLADAEMNVLDVFSDTQDDRALRHLLEDKAIEASLKKALTWANLSFLILKFNLFMQANNRFQDDKHILIKQQEEWKDKIKNINDQVREWRISGRMEEDHIYQENGLLAAQSESFQAKLLRINQNRRQESANILFTIQLLEEKLSEVQWLLDLLNHEIKKQSTFLERVWSFLDQSLTGILKQINIFGNFSLFKVIGIPITFFMIVKVIVIMIISFLISMLIRKAFLPVIMPEGKFSDSCGKLMHYCIILLGGVTALISIGIDSGNLFLLAGALVFGIGFGFQSVVNNIFCGFRMLFSRKIKIGDYVELQSGSYGKVTEIQLQYTIVTTSDGIDIIVPNSELIDNILINWTMNNDYRRLRIPFVTNSECDKELVRKVICEAALHVPCTIHSSSHFNDPQVWLVDFGDGALKFELVVWVNLRVKTKCESREADYIWEIETALRENQISMPMNEQRLYIERFKTEPRRIGKSRPSPNMIGQFYPDESLSMK